jgi:DNA replication protein DnaC
MWSGCPTCRAEAQARKEADLARECNRARELARVATGVPRRFSAAQLGTTGLHATLRAYASTLEAHLTDGDGLALIGPPGTGKSHGLAAMLLYLAERHAEQVIAKANERGPDGLPDGAERIGCTDRHGCLYRNAETLGLELRDTFGKGNVSELDVLGPFVNARLLALDEIGAASDDHTRKSIATILCLRYERRLPTIIAGNLSRAEIEAYLGARAADRLAECTRFVAVTGPSKRRVPALSTVKNSATGAA